MEWNNPYKWPCKWVFLGWHFTPKSGGDAISPGPWNWFLGSTEPKKPPESPIGSTVTFLGADLFCGGLKIIQHKKVQNVHKEKLKTHRSGNQHVVPDTFILWVTGGVREDGSAAPKWCKWMYFPVKFDQWILKIAISIREQTSTT